MPVWARSPTFTVFSLTYARVATLQELSRRADSAESVIEAVQRNEAQDRDEIDAVRKLTATHTEAVAKIPRLIDARTEDLRSQLSELTNSARKDAAERYPDLVAFLHTPISDSQMPRLLLNACGAASAIFFSLPDARHAKLSETATSLRAELREQANAHGTLVTRVAALDTQLDTTSTAHSQNQRRTEERLATVERELRGALTEQQVPRPSPTSMIDWGLASSTAIPAPWGE